MNPQFFKLMIVICLVGLFFLPAAAMPSTEFHWSAFEILWILSGAGLIFGTLRTIHITQRAPCGIIVVFFGLAYAISSMLFAGWHFQPYALNFIGPETISFLLFSTLFLVYSIYVKHKTLDYSSTNASQ